MARIVVIGAGLTGLVTALLLARDGHDVTVLERDSAEPDGDAESLWRNWERPGVSQFRLPHQMVAYWRRLMELELPEVIDEVERLGGRRINPIDTLPAALTGGIRAGDEDLRGMSARRPVLEGALAAVAARAPGVTVRRGAKVAALVPALPGVHGVPHVDGVVIEGGEKLTADLVVDAMGRNTSIDRMLDAIGALRPDEQAEELGFVYYCRQFRNNEPDSVPEIQADIAGTPHQPAGATWNLERALQRLVLVDVDALRIYMRSALHIEPLDPALFPATLRVKIDALDDDVPPYPAGGPTRAQLLAAVADQPMQTVA